MPRVETTRNPAVPRAGLPYLHMTINRLHVTVTDEAYLSHVLARSLRDSVGERVAG